MNTSEKCVQLIIRTCVIIIIVLVLLYLQNSSPSHMHSNLVGFIPLKSNNSKQQSFVHVQVLPASRTYFEVLRTTTVGAPE
mmetsp:Transcript_68/g.96  ORF Transcript_68/g.96 Transcript_68/m.96 type:complete len:81 (-) Transcript_68:1257-1499(-)